MIAPIGLSIAAGLSPVGSALMGTGVPEECAGAPPSRASATTVPVLVPPILAVIWTELAGYPVKTVAVKLADVAPVGTVTEAGTERLLFALLVVTVSPPAGDGPTKVTVQVADLPGVNVDGLQVTDFTGTGPTDTVALTVVPHAADTSTTV
ncbi:MAG TPA: hypothetical protein VIY49_03210 [Bryobacteraceae bacterium]